MRMVRTFIRALAGWVASARAVELLTRVLSQQPDGSVSIAQIGFSTNLARLVSKASGAIWCGEK